MKLILLLLILFSSCVPAGRAPYSCLGSVTKVNGDTIHEQMLVTVSPMGIAHARYGLAIVRNDTCRAHLYYDGRIIKEPVKVWDCETERKRRAK